MVTCTMFIQKTLSLTMATPITSQVTSGSLCVKASTPISATTRKYPTPMIAEMEGVRRQLAKPPS